MNRGEVEWPTTNVSLSYTLLQDIGSREGVRGDSRQGKVLTYPSYRLEARQYPFQQINIYLSCKKVVTGYKK